MLRASCDPVAAGEAQRGASAGQGRRGGGGCPSQTIRHQSSFSAGDSCDPAPGSTKSPAETLDATKGEEFAQDNSESFSLVTSFWCLHWVTDHVATAQLVNRVLKPGGKFYASVPASWPEKICWHLSKEYQNQPGGHLRIFNQNNLVDEIEGEGFKFLSSERFHSIHSPYWWLRCFFWNSQDTNFLVKLYKKLLERHILKKPIILNQIDKLLNPILGKSFSMYFEKL